MAKQNSVLKGYAEGFKSILSRNPLLVVILYSLNQYGNTMKNGFRTLVGVKDLGMETTVIGFALSVFLIAALITRSPAGAAADTLRSKLRFILVGSFILKGICWFGFTIVSDPIGFYVLFALDGVLWAFNGTILPAVMAISVDRRAMGSGFAIMMGIKDIVCASARATGINLYNDHGIMAAAAGSAATCVIAIIFALFLDLKQQTPAANTPQAAAAPAKKKGLLAGVCVSMIPLCIVGNMAFVLFAMESNYLQIYCDMQGFSYLTATTVGSTVLGIMNVVVGVLCDLINPAILVVIMLLGQTVAPFLWAAGTTSAAISVGIVIYYSTRCFDICYQTLGMKSLSKAEQGAFYATCMMGFDIVNIAASSVLGFTIEKAGYITTFAGIGVWNAIALVAFLILNATFLKKVRAKAIADEVPAE